MDVGGQPVPFAFSGRVSTEDNQDPQASRNWQLSRARALIEPAGGVIVAEYFDIGQSRSLPWSRRPRAADLLAALADPDRGFAAVVIGEPQRAFYGNQYGLTMPLFAHYGVQLWVPEVGGPIDPDSEAHDLIMSVFGGMSKGERTRIKIRVRSAMASQAKIEGRYLGGRPPYGYRLADAGPHPNPAKAADGKRLHRLEPDLATGPVVARIFAEYLAGRGLFAIAEGLSRDGIASPSQNDPARNRHRTGEGWSKAAIRAILSNPRYTGRQVWNRQRKDEILLDVHDVALGYETKMRWNDPGSWVWSDIIAQQPLVRTEDFEAAQVIRADAGRARQRQREAHQRVKHPYVLRGLLYCGICGRKMQAQHNNQRIYYRCRYPREYALANNVHHPVNVYLREEQILPAVDGWLLKIFAPQRLDHTIRELAASHLPAPPLPAPASRAVIAECDAKLARYQAVLDAGGDPATIASWTRTVTAQRTAALAHAAAPRAANGAQLAEETIQQIIRALGDMRKLIRSADPVRRAEIYKQLDLRLIYHPEQNLVHAQANMDPRERGEMGSVRGGT